VSYILEVTDIAPGALRNVLESHIDTQVAETVMSTAEKLREEGRVQGKAEGKAELVLKLLALRFGPLSESVQSQVRSASSPELDSFAERVLSAKTLQDVFASR
jgi:hypothetical protein